MAVTTPAALFADPAPAQRLQRAVTVLTAHGFTVEVLDVAAAARTRAKDLIPEGASVFTGASETLRLSGIDEDINNSGRYQAIKPRVRAMDRATRADDIRRLLASPDAIVGSNRLLILNAEPYPGHGTASCCSAKPSDSETATSHPAAVCGQKV